MSRKLKTVSNIQLQEYLSILMCLEKVIFLSLISDHWLMRINASSGYLGINLFENMFYKLNIFLLIIFQVLCIKFGGLRTITWSIFIHRSISYQNEILLYCWLEPGQTYQICINSYRSHSTILSRMRISTYQTYLP